MAGEPLDGKMCDLLVDPGLVQTGAGAGDDRQPALATVLG
jgi:hypothetical protein